MEINGISAIVTGGASGLGEATARHLAIARGQGRRRRPRPPAGEGRGPRQGDRRRLRRRATSPTPTQVIAAVEAAKELGPLKALVNCAGIGWATRTIGKDGEYASAHDLDIFKKVIEINLIGTFNCIRIAATAMSQNEPDEFGERGAIVNTASVAAEDGQIGQASLLRLQGRRRRHDPPHRPRPLGRRHPGEHHPPRPDRHPDLRQGEASEQFKERLAAGVLFPKRLGQASEFATLAVELLRNSYMNAESIRIDGGIRMQPK